MKESRELIQTPKAEPLEFERQFDPQIVSGMGRYPAYRETYAQDGFQLLDYWRAIRKRIWLVIGIAVLVTTLAAIYMARKPDIFSAKAQVQVDLEQSNQDLAINDRPRISNADPSYFNTQLQLLNSDTLLRRVIKEHNLDTNPEFQKAKNEGATSPWRAMLKAIGLASDDSKNARKGEPTSAPSSSTTVSQDEIAEAVRLAPYVEIIRKNLSVDPVRDSRVTVKDTRLIDVVYTNTDPELAAFVANSIGETFTNLNRRKTQGNQHERQVIFFKTGINELQSEIQTGEVKLVDLKQEVGILKTTGEQTIVLDRLGGLNKDLLTAENDRKNAQAEYDAVKNSPEKIKSLAEAASARYITERENYCR